MGSVHHGSNCSGDHSKKEETPREVLNISVTQKLVQNVQAIRSNGFHLERRVSPRLKNIPKEKRPYYGSDHRRRSSASEHDVCCRKIEDDDDQKGQFDEHEVNAPTSNAKDNIDANKTPGRHVSKIRSEGLPFERRVSPRLKDISADKGPYYGSDQRRWLNTSKGDLRNKETQDNYLNMQFDPSKGNVHEEYTRTEITATKNDVHQVQMVKLDGTKNDLALGFAPIEHNGTAIMDLQNEAYLELKRCETFLADSTHARSGARDRETAVWPDTFSNDSTQNSSKHNAENEILDVTLGKKVKQHLREIKSTGLPLERRVSPRNIEKIPFYGGNQEVKLNAANGFVCKNIDSKRKLSSPQDKTTTKNSRVDHLIQECLPIVGRKDRGDRDNVSLLDAGALPVKYKNTEIVDLENGAYLKSTGYERFLADQMCQKADARVKETMRALHKHHAYIAQVRASEDFSKLPGLVCMDISCGQESIPIPATNLIDPPIAPGGYKYTKTIHVGRNVVIPPSPPGCNCKGNCTNPKYCSCARLNGSDFPYVCEDGGRLIEPKDVVFECGPGCGCGPNCINRVSQREMKYQLEVYRTLNKGWAVRSWDLIPSGAFVCEYIGALRRCADLDTVSDNDYIFEIDCWHTMKGIGGRERRQGDVSMYARDIVDKVNEAEIETEFCVDGASYSNVTRFINHSCDPNLFVQCVLSSHRDIRLARIVLFAADDIPPMQELTYDYGYELDSVIRPDGKIKKMLCYCGTSECRGRLF